MWKRSSNVDVERAREHAEKRAEGFLHVLNDPNTPPATKEAAAERLARALSSVNIDRPRLKLVDESYMAELSEPTTSAGVDPFTQELDAIVNPPYRSPEWIQDTEGLFSEHATRVFQPAKPKTLLQKMKPIGDGRHAAENTSGRFKKLMHTLGSVPTSLTVKHSPFSKTEEISAVTKKSKQLFFNRRANTLVARSESTTAEHSRSKRKLRTIGAMALTTAVAAVSLFALASPSGESNEVHRDATMSEYENLVQEPVTTIETVVDSTPALENDTPDDTQTPELAETSATPTTITVTVGADSSIWEATEDELEKINPGVEVKKSRVADIANAILWFHNPDQYKVQPGTPFEVDLEKLYSITEQSH